MPKRVWNLFLIAISLMIMWHGYKSLKGNILFFKLDGVTQSKIIEWQVVETKKRLGYQLLGTYQFLFNDKVYQGQSNLNERSYHNAFAAFAEKDRQDLKSATIYFNTNHPEQNSLIKEFPWKSSIYTFLLVCVLIYFCSISHYVGTKYEGR
ncbi:MAG: hypothetical protein JHC93_04065 [Parachlamydiales bacterium]|nr:hypothetical protein [Parachlamydiales bacterium]